MATTVIKTIGPGGDYTTLAAAVADTTGIPTDLVAADQLVRLQVRGGAELATTTATVGVNRTWDATRRIILEPYPGEGFADNANKLTNALFYNPSNGAAIKFTGSAQTDTPCWDLQGISEIRGLQFRYDDGGNGTNRKLFKTDGRFIGNIIWTARPGSSETQIDCTGFVNNVFWGSGGFSAGSAPIIGTRFANGWNGGSSGVQVVANTFVCNNAARLISGSSSVNPVFRDNACFGINQFTDNGAWTGIATYTATDLASLSGTGNLVGKVATNQFVNATSDFRVKAGADLINAGTRDAANTSDLDILGQPRSTSTPTIGAHEYVTGGAAPVITVQPSPQSVTQPATATFSVTATGATSYQWQRSTDGGSTWNNVSTGTGGTTNSYTTAATSVSGGNANNNDQYRCAVTNANGTTNSNGALLSVASSNVAPSFTTQPSNQTTTAGATATFIAAATGTPNPSYLWQRSTDGGTTWNAAPGTNTNASYTTPATSVSGGSANNGDRFRCVATNSVSSVNSNSATLTVNAAVVGTITVSGIVSESNTSQGNNSIANVVVMRTSDRLVVYSAANRPVVSGVMTLQDAAIVAGTAYQVVCWNADGSLAGNKVFTAT